MDGHRAIDLSSATEDELRQLSGVGPALARRIVAWRAEHGGFTSVDQLAGIRGISPRVLEGLQPHVTAGIPVPPAREDAADRGLDRSPRVPDWPNGLGDPALVLEEQPPSTGARLRAYASEHIGNLALIAVIAIIELVIIVMAVRAL